jgi:hypothetical protein
VISSVNVQLKTNVSETSSVSITRVDVRSDMDPDDGDGANFQNVGF